MGDALDASCRIIVLTGTGLQPMTPAAVNADPLAQIAALQAAVATLTARVAILEAKPEEAAHFTAAANLPAISILSGASLTLSGLTAAKTGDTLKAGEPIAVGPTSALPNGAGVASARVTADATWSSNSSRRWRSPPGRQ